MIAPRSVPPDDGLDRFSNISKSKRQNCSLTHSSAWSVLVHVLHCSYVMRRKPRLHDGIVTIDLGKNRLAEIPCSGSDAPDHGFTRIQLISKCPKCNYHQLKRKQCAFACELRMRIWHA